MGFRFQRRVKLFPGFYLNVSKSGVSTSAKLGPLTLNSRGTATVGAHGTGLSYRADFAAAERRQAREEAAQAKRDAEEALYAERLELANDFLKDLWEGGSYHEDLYVTDIVGMVKASKAATPLQKRAAKRFSDRDAIAEYIQAHRGSNDLQRRMQLLLDQLKALYAFIDTHNKRVS